MPSPDDETLPTLSSLANANHLRQKRARSQLSCIPCRTGKLKCNRSHDPACDQCIKRNRESACLYVPPPAKNKPTQNVKGRIRQLESLVVGLMQQQNAQPGGNTDRQVDHTADSCQFDTLQDPTPPSDSDASPNNPDSARSGNTVDDVDGATKPFGQMKISKNGISYVGDSHWQAILDSISDLKRDLGEEEEDGGDEETQGDSGNREGHGLDNGPFEDKIFDAPPAESTGTGFMLGNAVPITRQQLIASVPEKRTADRLLSLWFNSPDPFKPSIHAPTFQEEYRKFWKDSAQTPTMWLGLLFAILSVAASFALRDIDHHTPAAKRAMQDVTRYHALSASAAVLGDFTQPKPYTLECLLMYAGGLRSSDAFVNVWLMLGLTARLALRMGYHRDPSNYPQISAFDGEMRRRVWSTISMIDVLISFQLGLPSLVKTFQSDTQLPRNLLDRDFNPSTKVLPLGRSIDELTPSSYTRGKMRIIWVLADATELSHATVAPSYETMMQLDRKLELAKDQIPPLLQMPENDELVTDPAEQLMCRFNLNLLYLKTKMVLHRRYMEKPFSELTPEEKTTGLGNSRKLCVDSGLRVLRHHHTIYTASQPGGQLESVKWYMGSISTHDFLLAAMIICLELSHQIRDQSCMHPSMPCVYRDALMQALEKSQNIWEETSKKKRASSNVCAREEYVRGPRIFDETEKASQAMAIMIAKVKAASASPPPATTATKNLSTPVIPLGYLQPVNPDMAFSGIVAQRSWDHMQGVPAPLAGTSDASWISPDSSSSGPVSMSSTEAPSMDRTNGTSPGAYNNFAQPFGANQPDFTVIENMLDVQGHINWETWDIGINAGEAPQWTQTVLLDNFAEPAGQHDAMTGMSDVGGAQPAANGNVYPGSWMAFQNMKDIDFDVDIG